jgi:hypothetical protein
MGPPGDGWMVDDWVALDFIPIQGCWFLNSAVEEEILRFRRSSFKIQSKEMIYHRITT